MIHAWTDASKQTSEARIYCPKCNTSKVIEKRDNPYWESAHFGKTLSTNCDKCREPIDYVLSKLGAEVIWNSKSATTSRGAE